MCGSRLPSACTSRCASSSRDALDAVEDRRHDHHRPRVDRERASSSSRGSRRGGIRWLISRCSDLDRQLARRHERRAARPAPASRRASRARRRRRRRRATSTAVPTRDRAEIAGRRVRGRTARRSRCRQSGLPADAALELPPAAADQVIADVRLARVGRALGDLPRALDALQRDAHLAFAGRLGQLLDGVAVAVAAAEVHPAVDAGRIALQHLLDEADALEELAPVEGRDQAQAADQVRHERLLGRLMLRLRADRVLDRLAARGQRRIELAGAAPARGLVLARALQQADDERRMHVRRPARRGVRAASRARRPADRRRGGGRGWSRGRRARVRRCSTSASFSASATPRARPSSAA